MQESTTDSGFSENIISDCGTDRLTRVLRAAVTAKNPRFKHLWINVYSSLVKAEESL